MMKCYASRISQAFIEVTNDRFKLYKEIDIGDPIVFYRGHE